MYLIPQTKTPEKKLTEMIPKVFFLFCNIFNYVYYNYNHIIQAYIIYTYISSERIVSYSIVQLYGTVAVGCISRFSLGKSLKERYRQSVCV